MDTQQSIASSSINGQWNCGHTIDTQRCMDVSGYTSSFTSRQYPAAQGFGISLQTNPYSNDYEYANFQSNLPDTNVHMHNASSFSYTSVAAHNNGSSGNRTSLHQPSQKDTHHHVYPPHNPHPQPDSVFEFQFSAESSNGRGKSPPSFATKDKVGSGEAQPHSNIDSSLGGSINKEVATLRIPKNKRPHSVSHMCKDDIYWAKRKKNNESAKRSRDARRIKEETVALRVVSLEKENVQLRTEVSLLKLEIDKLRCKRSK